MTTIHSSCSIPPNLSPSTSSDCICPVHPSASVSQSHMQTLLPENSNRDSDLTQTEPRDDLERAIQGKIKSMVLGDMDVLSARINKAFIEYQDRVLSRLPLIVEELVREQAKSNCSVGGNAPPTSKADRSPEDIAASITPISKEAGSSDLSSNHTPSSPPDAISEDEDSQKNNLPERIGTQVHQTEPDTNVTDSAINRQGPGGVLKHARSKSWPSDPAIIQSVNTSANPTKINEHVIKPSGNTECDVIGPRHLMQRSNSAPQATSHGTKTIHPNDSPRLLRKKCEPEREQKLFQEGGGGRSELKKTAGQDTKREPVDHARGEALTTVSASFRTIKADIEAIMEKEVNAYIDRLTLDAKTALYTKLNANPKQIQALLRDYKLCVMPKIEARAQEYRLKQERIVRMLQLQL